MARGGMGTVWLARDKKLGRQVAIKVMAQELAQMGEALQRFEREAQALAQLRSTHVVQVYDYGVQEGLPYIVMELLEGENLGQRLKRVGRLGVQEAVELFHQTCKGLKAAHNANLIHRDLKPSNIFIARRDDTEVIKLLDFGVVKAIDNAGGSDATVTGLLLGTPQYMSPEQARATRDIDHRSDLWSAAVIVFRMLTGQNPFKGESVGDVVLKICSDALPRISDYRQDLPAELDGFFARAFERGPNDRFQSATEMSTALTQLLVNAGVAQVFPGSVTQSGYNQPRPRMPSPSHAQRPSQPSQPNLFKTAVMPSQPPALTPVPQTNAVIIDTPVSTTVGGTQLASKFPNMRLLAGQPIGVVVGAASAFITVLLVAVIWLGSSPDPSDTAVEAGPAARADVDLLSNDDDGDPAPAVDEAEPAETAAVPEEPMNLDEPGDEQEHPVPTSTPPGPAPKPFTQVKPKQRSKAKPKPKKPDWGLKNQ